MGVNNFKELERIEIEESRVDNDMIRTGIASDIGIVRYVSDIVDHFLPKIFDLFLGMSGGDTSGSGALPKQKRYPDM